jgi:hypothetical protein
VRNKSASPTQIGAPLSVSELTSFGTNRIKHSHREWQNRFNSYFLAALLKKPGKSRRTHQSAAADVWAEAPPVGHWTKKR